MFETGSLTNWIFFGGWGEGGGGGVSCFVTNGSRTFHAQFSDRMLES